MTIGLGEILVIAAILGVVSLPVLFVIGVVLVVRVRRRGPKG